MGSDVRPFRRSLLPSGGDPREGNAQPDDQYPDERLERRADEFAAEQELPGSAEKEQRDEDVAREY